LSPALTCTFAIAIPARRSRRHPRDPRTRPRHGRSRQTPRCRRSAASGRGISEAGQGTRRRQRGESRPKKRTVPATVSKTQKGSGSRARVTHFPARGQAYEVAAWRIIDRPCPPGRPSPPGAGSNQTVLRRRRVWEGGRGQDEGHIGVGRRLLSQSGW
jgi:hypothetical protein